MTSATTRRIGRWLVVALLAPGALLVPQPASGSNALERFVGGSSVAGSRFYVNDKHRYASHWYAGAHRKMIPFGCTRAPYYPASDRCRRQRGFHHGLDIAMPCGTRLDAGMAGRVVRPASAGALGSAYGRHAFRLRNFRHEVDVVIGHVRRVYVSPGERVRRGQRIARASNAAAPDGCHLHFEVRPAGGGYLDAVRPGRILQLRRLPH